MAREYFCAYHSLIESLEPFGDAEKGRLFSAALVYSRDGAEPQLNGNERFIWPTIRGMIDRDKKSYEAACETRRENGAKGGRPKNQKNQMVFSETEKSQEEEKEEDKDEDEEKEKLSSPNGERENKAQAPARFRPPSLEEVSEYCRSRGNTVDPEAFIAFYASKGWKVGNQSMKDWKQAVITWEKRDAGKKAPPSAKGKTEEDRKRQEEADAVAMEQIRRLREKMRKQAEGREVSNGV